MNECHGEVILQRTNMAERAQNDSLELLSFHCKPRMKHIPGAIRGRKGKLRNENSRSHKDALEVSLGTMPIWPEHTKGKFLRIGQA